MLVAVLISAIIIGSASCAGILLRSLNDAHFQAKTDIKQTYQP